MKYVVIRVSLADGLTQKLPVIFPSQLVHQIVAEAFVAILAAHELPGGEPVSAGEVSLHLPGLECGGESKTLQLKADPEDSELFRFHDYLHGIEDHGDGD